MISGEPADGKPWVGGDFQRGPTADGSIALCGACRRIGRCRLGLRRETLGSDLVVTTELVCDESNEGGPGVAHGGWTAGALDELVGHVPLLSGQLAVTGELTVRFVKPVPIGRPLLARAWRQDKQGSRWFVRAVLVLASTGAELATGDGVLVERDATHFARHRAWLAAQDAVSARDVTASPAVPPGHPPGHDEELR
jgi:acyl-coenzyme A thioesterase PaaI-like protein